MPKQWHWATTDNAEKGIAGEKAVSEILSRLPQYEYRVFNNVLLNNPLGGTTQIDHIVVSRFGVIERAQLVTNTKSKTFFITT
ncbi:NERD domain-containing protein [bacterium]|nr:NERD domain-containing protein [bacterium]